MDIRDEKGKFIKGEHYSVNTQFKKGEHWRKPQPFREHDWLFNEYVTLKRPALDIANQFEVTEGAILFWLRKLNIPRRSMKTIRKIHHWGLSGEKNGMYGRRGPDSVNWKGGCTPERQALYSSLEWVEVVKEVWKRDNFKCRRCGCKPIYLKRPLHIHHIVTFANRDLRKNIQNLILLCPKCHRWVHGKRNLKHEFLSGQLVAL